MLHIGSHISSAGGFEAMGRHALLLHADTFGFFTRNPRGSRVKALIWRIWGGFKNWPGSAILPNWWPMLPTL